VGFKPEIPAIKWPQTHTVDCVATTFSRVLLEKMWGAHIGVAAEDTSCLGCDIVGQELPTQWQSNSGHIPADLNLQAEKFFLSSRIFPSFYQTQNFIVVFRRPYCDHVRESNEFIVHSVHY